LKKNIKTYWRKNIKCLFFLQKSFFAILSPRPRNPVSPLNKTQNYGKNDADQNSASFYHYLKIRKSPKSPQNCFLKFKDPEIYAF
jgi:hypothetical protein